MILVPKEVREQVKALLLESRLDGSIDEPEAAEMIAAVALLDTLGLTIKGSPELYEATLLYVRSLLVRAKQSQRDDSASSLPDRGSLIRLKHYADSILEARDLQGQLWGRPTPLVLVPA